MVRRAVLPLLGLLSLLSAAVVAQEANEPMRPIRVEDAWARPASRAGGTGAIYLTIRNDGQQPDNLLKVETPVAENAALHAMTMQGNIVRMREAPVVPLPSGGRVIFRPGGWHVMLTGLKGPLQKGATFPLILTFAKAGAIETVVAVRPDAPGSFWGGEYHNH